MSSFAANLGHSAGGNTWCVSMESELAASPLEKVHQWPRSRCETSSKTFRYFIESSPVGFRGQYNQATSIYAGSGLKNTKFCQGRSIVELLLLPSPDPRLKKNLLNRIGAKLSSLWDAAFSFLRCYAKDGCDSKGRYLTHPYATTDWLKMTRARKCLSDLKPKTWVYLNQR